MPDPLVVNSVATPVSTFRSVTFAPGTTALVWSVTVPRILPEFVFCATPGLTKHNITKRTDSSVNVRPDKRTPNAGDRRTVVLGCISPISLSNAPQIFARLIPHPVALSSIINGSSPSATSTLKVIQRSARTHPTLRPCPHLRAYAQLSVTTESGGSGTSASMPADLTTTSLAAPEFVSTRTLPPSGFTNATWDT